MACENDQVQKTAAGHTYVQVDVLIEGIKEEFDALKHTTLTPRERNILQEVANGKSQKQLIAQFHLAPRTLNRYLLRAGKKLGAPSRPATVAEAMRRSWIE